MVSPELLQQLLAWKTEDEGGLILSIYIDRRTGTGYWNAEDLAPLVKGLVKDLQDETGGPALERATQAALAALAAASPSERSLAAFAEPGGRVRTLEWNVPVSSQARWSGAPYLLPLLETLGGHERYGIALADRHRGRLFTMFLGTIQEDHDAVNPEPVQKVASTGSDQARTTNLQQRADEHAHAHLKHVASILESMAREKRFDRLILGGPTAPVNRLRELLSPKLVAVLAGVVHVPVDASKGEILAAAREIERRTADVRNETDVLELETASAKRGKAAAGLGGALEALREGRIRRLLYADGLSLRGRRCSQCGSLFDETPRHCGYCRGATRPVDDLLNEMAGRVAGSGGTIEAIAPPAADRLRRLGGLGAFLRF
jgi:peptide subunit release factor 1 (eRF1)